MDNQHKNIIGQLQYADKLPTWMIQLNPSNSIIFYIRLYKLKHTTNFWEKMRRNMKHVNKIDMCVKFAESSIQTKSEIHITKAFRSKTEGTGLY